jgi:hypothetical protein
MSDKPTFHRMDMEGFIHSEDPQRTHPEEYWRRFGHRATSGIVSNDHDGKEGGTQFFIKVVGTREELRKFAVRFVEDVCSYSESQLVQVTSGRNAISID